MSGMLGASSTTTEIGYTAPPTVARYMALLLGGAAYDAAATKTKARPVKKSTYRYV